MAFKKDFKKNEFFVCIPDRCTFGLRTMPRRYHWLRQKYPSECESDQYASSLWMLDEIRKGKKSWWKPFLDTRKKEFMSL